MCLVNIRKKKRDREAETTVTEEEVKGLRYAYRKNMLSIKKTKLQI